MLKAKNIKVNSFKLTAKSYQLNLKDNKVKAKIL